MKRKGLLISPFFITYLEMTSETNKFTAHFQLSSGDGGVLSTVDFNNLERKDLRNCSSLNICFEPEEISIPDVKITKMLIHYDGITDSPQDYFGFKFKGDAFQGSPNPIVTFELNKEVDPEEFRKSIWMSSICIFPEKVRERNGEAAFQQDNSGYTSIISQYRLQIYINQLSGAAIVPPKEISFSDGLEGFYELELKKLIGLNKSSQKTSKKKTNKEILSALKRLKKGSRDDAFSFLKKNADKKLKSDREFILEAIKINPNSFLFASKKLRSDREITIAAAAYPHALREADKSLRSDREIVLAFVNNDGTALWHADKKLQSDREIVLAAVRNDPCYGIPSLAFADKKLQSDREIVLAAVSQNAEALNSAGEELKSDREIVLAAVSQDAKALDYAGEELKSDREIVLAAERIREGEKYE